MGGTVTKSGVAVEGKAAADPANGKANGQVSAPRGFREVGQGQGGRGRGSAWFTVHEAFHRIEVR